MQEIADFPNVRRIVRSPVGSGLSTVARRLT